MTEITSTVNEVRGKVAIVRGAASGIGQGIAELLHTRGANVVAEDISPDVEKLTRPGLVPFVADVTVEGSAEAAVALAVEKFGRLEILVNSRPNFIQAAGRDDPGGMDLADGHERHRSLSPFTRSDEGDDP